MDFKRLQRPNIDLFQTVIFQTFKLSYEQLFSLMTAGPLATTQSPNISLRLKNLQCLSPKAIHEFSGGCGSGGRAGRPPTGRSVDPCSLPVTVSEFPPVRVCVCANVRPSAETQEKVLVWMCVWLLSIPVPLLALPETFPKFRLKSHCFERLEGILCASKRLECKRTEADFEVMI